MEAGGQSHVTAEDGGASDLKRRRSEGITKMEEMWIGVEERI